MKLIGVDGCKGGWIAVTSDESLRSLDFAIFPDFASLIQKVAQDDAHIVIDIPIGLSENGPRACDIRARELLGSPRSSSVFPAPCRPTLQATTYEEGCRLNFLASGKKVAKQTFAILPTIREVDTVMTPERQKFVREAHPEVTFSMLASTGRGLVHKKDSVEGERERIALLKRFVPHIDAAAVRSQLGAAKVARNDIIDAVACLVTVSRIANNREDVLPDGDVPRDARGLRMEIVA